LNEYVSPFDEIGGTRSELTIFASTGTATVVAPAAKVYQKANKLKRSSDNLFMKKFFKI
jgi:hypothetical protein